MFTHITLLLKMKLLRKEKIFVFKMSPEKENVSVPHISELENNIL